jgi:hypothetical protein
MEKEPIFYTKDVALDFAQKLGWKHLIPVLEKCRDGFKKP